MLAATVSQVMDGDPRRMHGGNGFSSYSTLQRASSCCRQNLRDPDEIVSSSGQYEEPLHQATATMAGLTQTADSLHPPERFFDPLALDGADPIARMTGRARIDCRPAVGIVLRDMRRAAAFTAASNKVRSIIVLVAAHRAARPGIVLDHIERSCALGRAVGLGQARIDDEPIAVLYHQI
jgi:hypothetical protein